jgi:hypothetical protein
MNTDFRKAARNCGKKAAPTDQVMVVSLPKTKKKLPSPADALTPMQEDRDLLSRVLISVLRPARQEADLTQRDIAEYLGYTEDVVGNMEAFRTPISWPDAILWARKSNLDDEEFFEAWTSLYAARKRKKKRHDRAKRTPLA